MATELEYGLRLVPSGVALRMDAHRERRDCDRTGTDRKQRAGARRGICCIRLIRASGGLRGHRLSETAIVPFADAVSDPDQDPTPNRGLRARERLGVAERRVGRDTR